MTRTCCRSTTSRATTSSASSTAPRASPRSSGREIKKVPDAARAHGRSTSSTRPPRARSSSFELAAKRLSAPTSSASSRAGSAVDKGESLKDTVQTLSAYDPAAIVIRSPHAGAAGARRALDARASVVNAGDGKHEHPTQALLDLYTLRAALGALEGLQHLDRRRRAAQPRRALEHPRLHAHGLRGHGLRAADADPARDRVARLRVALRRSTSSARPTSSTRCGCSTSAWTGSFVPSLREYAAQLPDRRPPAAAATSC